MQDECNRKLMGKKGKKYPAHKFVLKKILFDHNFRPPPPPPQEFKWSAPKQISLLSSQTRYH